MRRIFHKKTCIGGIKFRIGYTVELGVALCVADRRFVKLDSDDLFRVGGGAKADGSYSAIGVKHGFLPRKVGIAYRLVVKNLGLNGIYLIKRFGGNSEFKAAQHVLNIALAEKNFLPFTQHKACKTAVYVLYDGGYVRVAAQKLVYKAVCRPEFLPCGHKNHHYLARFKAPSHKHMAELPRFALFVIGLYFKIRTHFADVGDYFIGLFILKKTAVRRHDFMGT